MTLVTILLYTNNFELEQMFLLLKHSLVKRMKLDAFLFGLSKHANAFFLQHQAFHYGMIIVIVIKLKTV